MFLLLIVGLGTGRWEFYFLFTVLSLLVVAALILNLCTFFSFSCRYELASSRVTKGDPSALKVYIYNNKPYSLNMMRATVQTPLLSDTAKLIVTLAPKEEACYDIEISCKYRGVYEVGVTILEVVDIFGLLRMRFDLRRLPNYRLEQLIVYPRLLQLISPMEPAHGEAAHKGLIAQRHSEGGEEYYDTRLYRFGDPFKRIHRTLSARKRELHVKRYDIAAEATAIIIIDTCENSFEGEDSLRFDDIACECAVATVNCCLNLGHFVSLASSNADEPTIEGKSQHDFHKFVDYLAVMEFGVHGDINTILQVSPGHYKSLNAIYVISPRSDTQFSDSLSVLAQSGKYVRLFLPSLESVSEEEQLVPHIEGVTVTVVKNVDDIAY